MSLTADDVRSKQFTMTRFKPGYAEDEVDAFLDEIVEELRRLSDRVAELERQLRDT
jgi:DivIVA domain-containing protein